MPAKKPAKKTKATQVSKTKTNPWKVVGIVFASIVVVLVANALIFTRVWKVTPFESAKISTYLKDKYGQEFVVSNLRLEASYGSSGYIRADAYPKSDPMLKFTIAQSENDWATNKYDKDGFLQALWTKQANTEVDKFIKEQLPGVDSYNADVHFSPGSKATYDAINGTTPSLDELRQQGLNGFGLSLTVRSVAQVSQGEPTSEQLEHAFKIVDFVKKFGSVSPEIEYAYRDNTFNVLSEKTKTQEYQYAFKIDRNNINNINSPNDLANYFERIDNND